MNDAGTSAIGGFVVEDGMNKGRALAGAREGDKARKKHALSRGVMDEGQSSKPPQ